MAGLHAFTRFEIPEKFHYRGSSNSAPILVTAEEGTVILASDPKVQRPIAHTSSGKSSQAESGTRSGLDGYDPDVEDMRGIFLAKGPHFKMGGEEVGPIELVDVYQLLAHLLRIKTNPHNGTWSHVSGMLVEDEYNKAKRTSASILLKFFCAVVAVLGLLPP